MSVPPAPEALAEEWSVADTGGGRYCGQGCRYGGYDDFEDKFPDVVLFHGLLVGISITYIYTFLYAGKGILVFRTDNTELARKTIFENNLPFISEEAFAQQA